MPTPNLYVDSKSNPFAAVPPEFRNNQVDVLYATDRKPIKQDDGRLQYGIGRSTSLAFGSCVVEIGKDIPWDTLVANSRVHDRSISLELTVREITEYARFPDTPVLLVRGKKDFIVDPAVESRYTAVAGKLRQELNARLARTPRKEAYIFIHGVNNTFETAVVVIAELWHFLGRQGVPILYTWPAGRAGLLKGYTYDRESSEFTIYHLKEFIRILATTPALEKIHIIAHSRGTDVAASAVRELVIEARAAGVDPHVQFKIGNLILVAPDLDLDVVTQRLGAERFFLGSERLTVYVSEEDQAIALAGWLFTSRRRIGHLRPEDFTAEQRKILERLRKTQFIDVRVPSAGHAYFRTDPSASSDLILLLRENRDPGIANGRPLIEHIVNFWELYKGYPGPPQEADESP
ncbi:MAG: alpha/beta hydrolase [Terriglobia bacterium]